MIVKIDKSISSRILLFFFFLAIFPIDSFVVVKKWTFLHYFQSALFILSMVIVFLVILLKKELPWLCAYFIGIMFYYLINTAIVDSNTYSTKIIKIYLSVILLAYVSYLYSCHNAQEFIAVAYVYYSVMVYLNGLFLCLHPNGLGRVRGIRTLGIKSFNSVNFLGVDNRLAMWFIVAIIFLALYKSDTTIKKINDIALLIAMLAQIIWVWSATGIVGVIAAVILVLVSRYLYLLSVKRVLIMYLIATIGVISYNVQSYFSNLIILVLKKSVNLSNRVDIWRESLEMINKRPLFGYGYSNNGIVVHANSGIWYSHNLLLDILIQGGFILLLLFVILAIVIDHKSVNSRRFDKIVVSGFAAFMLTAIAESYLANIQFFFVIILMFYSNEFGKQIK